MFFQMRLPCKDAGRMSNPRPPARGSAGSGAARGRKSRARAASKKSLEYPAKLGQDAANVL